MKEPGLVGESIYSQVVQMIKELKKRENKVVIFIALNEFYKSADERVFQKTRFFNQELIRVIKSSAHTAYFVPAVGNFYICTPGVPLKSTKLSDLRYFDRFYARLDGKGQPCAGYKLSRDGLEKLRELIQAKIRTIDAQLKFSHANDYLQRFRD